MRKAGPYKNEFWDSESSISKLGMVVRPSKAILNPYCMLRMQRWSQKFSSVYSNLESY